MIGLTIVVPALNEEARIAGTVHALLQVMRSVQQQFEIIIVDDGSTDKTGEIAEDIAREDAEVRVVHNPERQGLGSAFRTGIREAKFDYLSIVPGDGAYDAEGLLPLVQSIGTAELIVGYRTNQSQARQRDRVFISQLFHFTMEILLGQRLKDFHAACIYPVQNLRQLTLVSTNYTYQIETLTKLLRQKVSYVERPVLLNRNKVGRSSALRFKTFTDVAKIILHLWDFM